MVTQDKDTNEHNLTMTEILLPSTEEVSRQIRYGTYIGLALPDNLTFERWEQFGKTLRFLTNASRWWLGDWLYYGESKFANQYEVAMGMTGYSYKTCLNAKSVASRIPRDRRREGASFEHHAAVASFDPDTQDNLLDLCEAEGLTLIELREEIKSRRLEAEGQKPPIETTATTAPPDVLEGTGEVAMESVQVPVIKPVAPNRIQLAPRKSRISLVRLVRGSADKARRFAALCDAEMQTPGSSANAILVAAGTLDTSLRELMELMLKQ